MEAAHKNCAACGKRKPVTEFRRRASSPDGFYYQCRECVSLQDSEYRRENHEQVRLRKKQWAKLNPEYDREAKRRRRNAGVARESVADLRLRNPDAYARMAAKWAKRDADRDRATPPWFDAAKTQAIYLQAARMRAAGFNVHVDHIVPLRGDLVCGLHVHYNLRVIPAVENLKKGARLLPEHAA